MNYEMGGSGNGCAIEENRIFVQKCFDGVVYSIESRTGQKHDLICNDFYSDIF